MKKALQIAADYLFSADKELYNGLIRCGGEYGAWLSYKSQYQDILEDYSLNEADVLASLSEEHKKLRIAIEKAKKAYLPN